MSQENNRDSFDCVVVGAGFTGLTAAYYLARGGKKVCVVEAEKVAGGLAGVFEFSDGTYVEKFYHHWFKSDSDILGLISDLALMSQVKFMPSHTGSYVNGRVWKLSKPSDLLWFQELTLAQRIRLGLVVLYARRIKHTQKLESSSIREWLEPLVGKKVFEVVWEPLLQSKFGHFADEISASWMWKKLALRGHSRQKGGHETLAYFAGGFGGLIESLVQQCETLGVRFFFDSPVSQVNSTTSAAAEVVTEVGTTFLAKAVLLSTPLPVATQIVGQEAIGPLPESGVIPHLSNICLVLQLSSNLSDTYWLNVNDPGFPFVGVIEHTNLDPSSNYGGSHIVYLSRYLVSEDPAWSFSDKEYFEYAIPHLKKIFPEFQDDWVRDYKLWKARYAQPITSRHYSTFIPSFETSLPNVFLQTMAQIYPEDRGTNYAVRDGRVAASKIACFLSSE